MEIPARLGTAEIGEFPYERCAHPFGWLFRCDGWGTAFGSTFGVVLDPFVGWRVLFVDSIEALEAEHK